MTRNVTIGENAVAMTSNAATAFRFRQVFGSDLIKMFNDQGENLDIYVVIQMGYIMKLQAEGSKFIGVSEDDYVAWLEQYETMDMFNAAKDIISLWVATNKTASKPKKK